MDINPLILFFSGVVFTIFFTYLLSIYFFKGYSKRREEIKKKEEEFLFKLNSQAIILRDALNTFEKYDLLFSYDLVAALMSNADTINFSEFMVDVFSALHRSDDEILKDTKILVLRSVSVNVDSTKTKFVFQAIIPEKNEGNI